MMDRDGSENQGERRALARHLAEKAEQAAAEGDTARAATLADQAARTDPEAVANVLDEGERAAEQGAGDAPSRDDEVAAVTRTIRPGQAAPPRAGITGAGSGADAQGISSGIKPHLD